MSQQDTKATISRDEFLQRIFGRYPVLKQPDEIGRNISLLTRLYAQGWTVGDTIAYCACWEEVNPSLDEDVALSRMAKLTEKYAPAV